MCTHCDSKSGRLLGVGRTGLGAGSAAIALLVPKCPLCVAAWAWAFSALGVRFERWDAIKWPVTVGFLVLAALLLGFKSKPWVKAAVLFGSGVCLSFKGELGSSPMGLSVGIGLSAVAAVSFYGFSTWAGRAEN